MADNSRIEDLRRRVQRDPASIAFAQLAEELRRAGVLQESVDACRAGLAIHPTYLSARVTLGRALLELNQLDAAAAELLIVLRNAPENLAATKAMGEIHLRRGEEVDALARFRSALAIARNDPDLEEMVADLARKLEPKPPASADGLTQSEFLMHLPAAPAAPTALPDPPEQSAPIPEESAPPPSTGGPEPGRDRAVRTVAALEGLLDAIHVARPDGSA